MRFGGEKEKGGKCEGGKETNRSCRVLPVAGVNDIITLSRHHLENKTIIYAVKANSKGSSRINLYIKINIPL